jgi:hypothetical protein
MTFRWFFVACRLLFVTGCFGNFLVAQQISSVPKGGEAAPPIYVLYRMMFRHIAELDTAAGDLDTRKVPGGPELRRKFQKDMGLSDATAAALKKSAVLCNQQLGAQDAKAVQVVTAAKAQDAQKAEDRETPAGPVASAATKTMLETLEQERTEISKSCMTGLQTALGARAFNDIDVYVRTVIAGRTVVVQPAMTRPVAPLSSVVKGGN